MLNPKLTFVDDTTFSVQMKRLSPISKLLGTMIGNHNNRASVYRWQLYLQPPVRPLAVYKS